MYESLSGNPRIYLTIVVRAETSVRALYWRCVSNTRKNPLANMHILNLPYALYVLKHVQLLTIYMELHSMTTEFSFKVTVLSPALVPLSPESILWLWFWIFEGRGHLIAIRWYTTYGYFVEEFQLLLFSVMDSKQGLSGKVIIKAVAIRTAHTNNF